MNYYPFHIGDYLAHTSHLEPWEDIAYRRLLDLYYLSETILPLDVEELARLIRMRDESALIQSILVEFFEQTSEGWRHERCEREISHMQDKQAKARASAKASVNARRANAERTFNERSTDVELPTPTPTPIPKEKNKNITAIAAPDGVSNETWDAFKALRKAKKAPISNRALQGIASEALKAGWTVEQAMVEMLARGWTGFKAEWVQKKEASKETFYEREMRARREEVRRLAPGVAARDPFDPFTFDMEVTPNAAIESD